MPLLWNILGLESGILSRQGALFTGGPPEGFLQKFHPGARLIALVILLLGISLCESPLALFMIFAGTMILAVISYLNLASIYRIMFVPLVCMAIPSWLAAALWYDLPLRAGAPFFLRILASVGVGAVILHSVGLRRTGHALAWMGLPAELLQSWSMMLNQVVGFSELVDDMAMARNARRIKSQRGGLIRRQIGTQMGILFARTYQRGNRLAMAMESRRIIDEPGDRESLRKCAFRLRDYGILIVSMGLVAAAVTT